MDAQAAYESASSLWPAFLAGANFVLHSAGWLEAGLVMSYEKFVIDAEQCGAFHVVGRGMVLDDNGFAMDAFAEVGPGSHFLGSAHTMRNFETAFFDFELSDNNSFEQWTQEGSHDIVWRANRKWKALLDTYQPPAVDAAKDEALKAFISARKASMPDMNY
jgi:trimethylamine--corrinoid protein Co-methyltransferase